MSDDLPMTIAASLPERTTVKQYLQRYGISYSHRNGETEPPTIVGLYWLIADGARGGTVAEICWDEGFTDEEMNLTEPSSWSVRFIGSEVDVEISELGHSYQWWGPLTSPSEQKS